MFSIAADVKFWAKGLGTPHILRFSLAEGRIYESK
jgi:hypothetical protein